MNKLKTMKDIFFGFDISEFFMVNNIRAYIAADICAKIQLRQKQEAVKWIKEICKDGFNKCPTITINGEEGQLMKALIKAESSLVADWIIHFFNLKEEDLK